MGRLIVIGGGAAGMMAAAVAAAGGVETVLIEKNEKLGKKVYITGKGRCNLTNDCDVRDFLKNVVSNEKFLYSALYGFSPQMTIDYLSRSGLRPRSNGATGFFPSAIIRRMSTNTLKRR